MRGSSEGMRSLTRRPPSRPDRTPCRASERSGARCRAEYAQGTAREELPLELAAQPARPGRTRARLKAKPKVFNGEPATAQARESRRTARAGEKNDRVELLAGVLERALRRRRGCGRRGRARLGWGRAARARSARSARAARSSSCGGHGLTGRSARKSRSARRAQPAFGQSSTLWPASGTRDQRRARKLPRNGRRGRERRAEIVLAREDKCGNRREGAGGDRRRRCGADGHSRQSSNVPEAAKAVAAVEATECSVGRRGEAVPSASASRSRGGVVLVNGSGPSSQTVAAKIAGLKYETGLVELGGAAVREPQERGRITVQGGAHGSRYTPPSASGRSRPRKGGRSA